MKIRWFMYAPVQEIGTALVQLDRVMPHMAAMTPGLLALSGVASTLLRRQDPRLGGLFRHHLACYHLPSLRVDMLLDLLLLLHTGTGPGEHLGLRLVGRRLVLTVPLSQP